MQTEKEAKILMAERRGCGDEVVEEQYEAGVGEEGMDMPGQEVGVERLDGEGEVERRRATVG